MYSDQILKNLKERKNLTQGIRICISCGSGDVQRGKHVLYCIACNYVNSYEGV